MDDDDPWGFLPREWPEIETEREYQALTMMLAGFNEAIELLHPGDDAREAFMISADGLRHRVRTWEIDHGIEPPGRAS